MINGRAVLDTAVKANFLAWNVALNIVNFSNIKVSESPRLNAKSDNFK
jgi:hypothetical protein